jgi:hypothetical protein
MKFIFTLTLMLMALSGFTQKTNKTFLKSLLLSHLDLFKTVLAHPNQNEVQILYTQIDRDKNNLPHFKQYSYRLNPQWYFYPASTVKLPAAIFALEKINELNIKGLTKESAMLTDSSFIGQTKVTTDSSSQNKLPSIANYIKKILLVSDNDAFNRLYEFIGRAELNRKLQENKLNHSRIINRLAIGDSGEQARNTNPIHFKNESGEEIYLQQAQHDPGNYPLKLNNLIRGKGYLNAKDELVNKPFDFSDKNVFTISDQQAVLKKLMFPEVYPKELQFNLTADDYNLIYKYMSMYPPESKHPAYDSKEYWDTYCKFLFYGSEKQNKPSPNIRIFNKVGDSYGYTIDNSYFVDFDNKVEFMLTAVIQSNENEIYNDNKYEYETVCFPFLKNLGHVIYDHELKRKKKHLPDLNKFKFDY